VSGHFDFAVFGSGFGGSIMSMVLRRLGYSVLLLEKSKHPRFAIGESTTPFSNLLLERIAVEFNLPMLRPLCEWGTWQKNYPQLPVGLKRGFTFYHHKPGEALDWNDRATQFLVAASPCDRLADTHWYRPSVDEFLAREARKLGVEFLDQFTILKIAPGAPWEIQGQHPNSTCHFTAGFVLDASGGEGVLANTLSLQKMPFDGFPDTFALYAHFRDVLLPPTANRSDTPPYNPENAAVHHVFDGGWAWVLRFNNGITSAGAVVTSELMQEIGFSSQNRKDFAALLARFPALDAIFSPSEPVTSFDRLDHIAFLRDQMAGENWALLPSAAGFVDPLLSTGFALNLLGIWRLANMFRDRHPDAEALSSYQSRTRTELEATANLIRALYAKTGTPDEFNRLTLLYFAALSFTETMWRLGKPESASQFLLTNDARFKYELETLCALAAKSRPISSFRLRDAIGKWDVAGLTDDHRNNWFPADYRDLFRSSLKLNASQKEILEMLQRSGLDSPQ
jgi:FADH2 O2-dependent halogenase